MKNLWLGLVRSSWKENVFGGNGVDKRVLNSTDLSKKAMVISGDVPPPRCLSNIISTCCMDNHMN